MAPRFLSSAAFDDENLQARLPFVKRREPWLFLLVVVLGLALYLPMLGDYALWDPWEPQYSQVAMEMERNGEWLIPLYRINAQNPNGEHWWSKPILPLWMFRASFTVFGESEFSARLPIVLTAVFGLALMGVLLGRGFGWRVGLLFALILGSSPQFFFISRQAIFDSPYVVFQTLALILLLLGLFKKPGDFRYIGSFWAVSGLAMLCKGLLAIVIPAAILGAYILATWEWKLLKRMKFQWGLPIFFIVCAPWFVYMTAEFGPSYLKDFFWYHHFKRMAGEIKKPNNSFDLYVRQIFMATFPWSAFFPLAAYHALKRKSGELYERAGLYLFVFLSFVMPYIFFSLGSTKFNHYIFPSVPFIALLVAIYLDDHLKKPGFSLPRLDLILATCFFAIFAKDIVTSYKVLIHLFIYYYERTIVTPVNPNQVFSALFIALGALLGLGIFWRRATKPLLAAFAAVTIGFMCYCNFVVVPPITNTYSMKPMLEAYQRLSKPGEPICEFNSWTERSTTYYFENKSVWINSTKPGAERRFFSQPGRLFCMTDRSNFSTLQSRVKASTGRDLEVVYSEHPYQYLVATTDAGPKAGGDDAGAYLLQSPPSPKNPLRAEWAGKIRLLGYDTGKNEFRPGESFALTLYFQVLEAPGKDYQIFLHGDEDGNGRLRGDHQPAGGRYPTSRWQAGQIIKDVWMGEIPNGMGEGKLDLFVGFFDNSQRLPIKEGPNDGENRLRLGSVRVSE